MCMDCPKADDARNDTQVRFIHVPSYDCLVVDGTDELNLIPHVQLRSERFQAGALWALPDDSCLRHHTIRSKYRNRLYQAI